MKKFSCIIVDDEETARRGLTRLVEETEELDLIATCANGIEAIDAVQAHRPQIVFLDVQMPGISGFEVLASLKKPWPQVIFTTAHDEYAIKAFDINAVDYLLKPFSDERFAEAVRRAQKRIHDALPAKTAVENLVKHARSSLQGNSSLIDGGATNTSRLVIKSEGSIHLLNFSDIRYIEAFDYYVKIHVANRFFLLRETMKSMEERLMSDLFVRIHKSYIVNLSHLKALHKQGNNEYEAELNDHIILKVSRNFKAALMDKLPGN